MKRKLAITGIFCLLLVILLGFSAFIMSRYIDPNKYKGKISQYVYAKTGQVLVINGQMQWSLFPWVGLRATNLTYYNAPDFTPKTFISAKEMDIKVKLIPLIRGKVEVGNVTLDHAVLNLIKNAQGKFNWQTLTKKDHENDKDSTPSKAVATLTIQSLKIKNSKLNWYDQAKKSHTKLGDLNITSKNIQFGQPFPLDVDFNLLDDKNNKTMAIAFQSDLTVATNYQKYTVSNLVMKSDYFLPKEKLALKVQGNLNADLTEQQLTTALDVAVADLNLKLNLTGNIGKQLNLAGTISTDEFDLKDLLHNFDVDMHTKNNQSLHKVTMLSKLHINDKNIELGQLHAKIDQSNIFGNVQISMQNKSYHFNLNTNVIDINDYLSDGKDTGSSSKVAADKSKSSPWNVAGSFRIDNLKAEKLTLNNVNGNISANKNLIRISPLRANFYKGTLDGTISVDKHDPNRTTTYIKESANNIDIKELLHQFSDSDKLSGLASLSTDLSSVTSQNSSFVAGLNGKIRLTLAQGSLQGVDVIYQLSRAHAFIKHLSSRGLSDSKHTDFASLTTTGIVNNGVINMDDLAVTSEYLKVSGKGTTNLVNNDIHYSLNALAQPKLVAVNDQIGKEITVYQVPIKVSGKLNKPSVNVDYAELAKTFIAKEIQKPISNQINKNLNNLKNGLKDKVGEKIKSFSPVSLLNKLTSSHDEESTPNNEAQEANNQTNENTTAETATQE